MPPIRLGGKTPADFERILRQISWGVPCWVQFVHPNIGQRVGDMLRTLLYGLSLGSLF